MKLGIVITVAVVLIAIVILFFIAPKISAYANLSEEKCNALGTDDCWHSLAHQTLNATFCNNIKDAEAKEHCLEHAGEK